MRAFGPYVNNVTIDFKNGLAGSNFFLIHGATGSGKTTILDAICYAIYGKCSGEKRTGEMMRSEKADEDIKTAVEFTFTLDGKIYRVVRCPKYRRKSLRGDGYVVEPSTVEIYVDDKLVPNTRDNDFFKNLLQFDVDQFRQVVVLPQGNFRKFLMSNSGERGEILNVIFNANLYRAVEVKLKEKFAEAKIIADDLNLRRKNFIDEAKNIGNVDDEGFNENSIDALIKTFNVDLKKFDAEIAQLRAKAETAAAQLTDGKTLYADFERYDISIKNLQDAKNSFSTAEKNFTAAQIEYDARKNEESRRLELERIIMELKKIQDAIADLQAAKSKCAAAEKNEVEAKKNLEKLLEDKPLYEKRLKALKAQIEKFDGADVKFKDAAQKLDQAKEYQAKLTELERLKKELKAAESRLDTATKNFDETQIKLNRLIALQKLGVAAKLAATLKEGEPCPVCGSTVHPHLAVSEEVIPTDEEIEHWENILKRRQLEKERAVSAVAQIKGKVNAISDALEKYVEVMDIDAAQKFFNRMKAAADELKNARSNLQLGEELTEKLNKEIDAARLTFDSATKIAENLRGVVSEKTAQISAEYLKDAKKISDDLQKNQSEKSKLDAAFNAADKNLKKALSQKSKLEGEIKSAEKIHADAAKKIDGKVKPNIAALKSQADAAQNLYLDKMAAAQNLNNNLKRLQNISLKLHSLTTEIQAADENFNMWEKLSSTANGRLSFQRYYLNSMFQHVIGEANTRLDKMSGGRYQFRNKEQTNRRMLAGLDLEIFDANSGTCRDVATLSGGESFLASLALALGLAAVVKNTSGGIKLDTIFIDEGFGSLDSETLDYAINTLIDLQSNGRLVGIISHVEELRQRVPNCLEISKHKNGSTAQFRTF